MEFLAIGVVYLIGWRWLFRWMIEECFSRLTWGDVGAVAALATLSAPFWPVIAIAAGVVRLTNNRDPCKFARVIAGESRRARAARLEREAREAQTRIARLEQELLYTELDKQVRGCRIEA